MTSDYQPRSAPFVGMLLTPLPSVSSHSDREEHKNGFGPKAEGIDDPMIVDPATSSAQTGKYDVKTNEFLEIDSQVDYDDDLDHCSVEHRSRKQPLSDKFFHLSAFLYLLQRYLAHPLTLYPHFVPSDVLLERRALIAEAVEATDEHHYIPVDETSIVSHTTASRLLRALKQRLVRMYAGK